jgi:hypothetical protein
VPKVKPDPEETKEEQAARRIDAASKHFEERCDKFVKTLRANARGLTPYKRQLTSAWLTKHCARLQATLDESEGIPPLGLTNLPDYE